MFNAVRFNAVRSTPADRDEVLSLEVLARATPAETTEPTQFRVLVRHFLDRFFAGEIASADADTKTRLVQVACALGLPPLVLSLYLYTPYHLPHHTLRPYWDQVGDHYFYLVYAMVSMGLVLIFEWDLLFPDLLDVFILSALPLRLTRLFAARVTAISILIAAALFDSGFLALLVLPAATDPPHLFRFLTAHLAAVTASGIFGATSCLAIEGVLLGLLGDRLFRKISLWLQGFFVLVLLTLLFSYPVIVGAIRSLAESRSAIVFWLPPFWFLGLYQRILDGAAASPVLIMLGRIGCIATLLATLVAAGSYPLAWWRRRRGLIEGAITRQRRSFLSEPAHRALHSTVARTPVHRAIWHFIGQNLLRVPRYRMVLVMYGGAGAALILATVMRVSLIHGRITLALSPGGLRATVPIVAFWVVSGMRSTFLAPADERGRWIFRVTLGKPNLESARTTQQWAFLWSLLLSLMAVACIHWAQPAAVRGWNEDVSQILVAVTLSLLLTDAFFLNIRTIPFTGTQSRSATNLALLLIPYLGFFPAIVWFTVAMESWIEHSALHLLMTATVAGTVHFCLRTFHKSRILENLQQLETDEDEEEFPLRLGLRY